MSEESVAEKEENLSRLLKHVWANSEITRERREEAVMIFGTDSGTVNVNPEGAKAFESAVDLLFSIDEIANRVSRNVVEDSIRKEMARLHQSPRETIEKNARDSASHLVHELVEYPVEDCKVNFPVFGLELFPPTLEIIIGNVVIYSLAAGLESESTKWLRHISPEGIKSLQAGLGLENRNVLGGSNYWAKAMVQSNRNDRDRLHLEGSRLIREALALLEFFMYAVPKTDYRRPIYPRFPPVLDIIDVEFTHHHTYVRELDADGKYWIGVSRGISKVAESYYITKEYIDAFMKEGFGACSDILETQNPTPLHRRIRRALEYFGLGMRTSNLIQRYVMYVSALEPLLLMEDEREGISQKLSYRVAFLLQQTPKDREKLFSMVTNLYKLRSDIVHGDFVNTRQVKAYLPLLHRLLYSIVKRLATGPEHFTSVGDVVEWARRRSLGYD